jgi:Domain of unknown function (DUF4190)
VSFLPPDEPVPPPGGYLDDRAGGGYGQMSLPPPADPYGPPPGYPPAYGYGAPRYVQPRNTNGMAIASLVCGVVGFSTCGVTSILAVIFGHIGLGQIKRNDEDGHGFAIAGLVLGYIAVGLAALVIVILIIAASA